MSITRVAAVTATAILTALALTGCLRLELDATITSEGEVASSALVLATNKETLLNFGLTDDEDGLRTFLQADQSPEDLPEENCTYSQTDTEVKVDCLFDGRLPSMFSGEDGPRITASDGSVQFFLATEAPEEEGSPDSSAGQLSTPALTFVARFNFPGPVESATGPGVSIDPTDPNLAVIDLTKGTGEDIVIVAAASEPTSDAEGSSVLWIFTAVVGVLLILPAAITLVKSRSD